VEVNAISTLFSTRAIFTGAFPSLATTLRLERTAF
jgi:hypothetical protein